MSSAVYNEELAVSYTREAFMHPANLAFLLASSITAFFLNDVGSLSSLIFTFAFGAELIFLGTIPRLSQFQKMVKVKKLKEQKSQIADKELFSQLDPATQKRFLVLKHLSKLIKENFDKMPYTSQGLLQSIQKKLEGLLTNYLGLLDSYKRYQHFIEKSKEDALKAAIAEEKKEMKQASSDKLKQFKARRVFILNKRYERLLTAKERFEICETQLETIEDAVKYIYEQSMTMNNPEEIGFQLDNLLNEVEETSTIFAEIESEAPAYSIIDEIDLEALAEPDLEEESLGRTKISE